MYTEMDNSQQLSNIELSVIQILINVMTKNAPKFHKCMIHIPVNEKEKAHFKFAYDSLHEIDGWKIKSRKNLAKVRSFTLDSNRGITIQVYPRGKIISSIKCSLRSFDFSSSRDSREFFEAIGIINYCLTSAFRNYYHLPSTGEWLLKQYDRDVTLVTSELERKYPFIRNWYSKEGVRISALGHIFQIYGKIIPRCGRCLRFEENVTITGDISIEQAIKEAINRPFEIIELLETARKGRSKRF